jgi:predicted enzyme related to lactoylglutathione lyase
MNPVVHFEMPAEDTKRMVQFYTRVFGWQTTQLGPEMGHYVLVQTTENEENGFPKEPGRINGGFAVKSKDNQATSVVIAVDDIHDAMKKVTAAGGRVLHIHLLRRTPILLRKKQRSKTLQRFTTPRRGM